MLSTGCSAVNPPPAQVDLGGSIERLEATGCAIPVQLLRCEPLPPAPGDDEGERADWVRAAAIVHEICMVNIAAARKLQRERGE
jgi:hypothetical protein